MAKFDEEKDRQRVSVMFDFDTSTLADIVLKKSGYVLGIDEVGRGPVAGPVAAGGVVYEKSHYIKWLNDSKKITEKRRPLVADDIKAKALFSHVEMLDASVIDEIGIAGALKLLFKKMISCCEDNGVKPDIILVDGNNIDLEDDRVRCVVKGDAKSAAIASASVLAKVERDRLMTELDEQYPEYEWSKNKGYGTKSHLQAIERCGVCEYHRKSFLSKYI